MDEGRVVDMMDALYDVVDDVVNEPNAALFVRRLAVKLVEAGLDADAIEDCFG